MQQRHECRSHCGADEVGQSRSEEVDRRVELPADSLCPHHPDATCGMPRVTSDMQHTCGMQRAACTTQHLPLQHTCNVQHTTRSILRRFALPPKAAMEHPKSNAGVHAIHARVTKCVARTYRVQRSPCTTSRSFPRSARTRDTCNCKMQPACTIFATCNIGTRTDRRHRC